MLAVVGKPRVVIALDAEGVLTADERRDAVYRMAKRRSLKLMNQLSIDAGEIERFEDLDAGPAFIEAVRELSRQYRDESR